MMFSVENFNSRICHGGSGGGSGMMPWGGSTPPPPQAPAPPESAGGGFYQGAGMWLPGMGGSPLNQPQSAAIPSTGASWSGFGPYQTSLVNQTVGQQAPQAPQAPQALLNSMQPQQGASMGMQGPGGMGQGPMGSMGTYAGGNQGANQWWGANGRPWGM